MCVVPHCGPMSTRILIVYDTNGGNTYQMARMIGRGVNAVPDANAEIRAVPKVSTVIEATDSGVPESGAPYVSIEDLHTIDGLIIGSPTHFGNMSASLKHFLDQSTSEWFASTLAGKPAAVFTSTSTQHGGQESTLLSMMTPLLHHGMLITGIPYSEPALNHTSRGGTPYGASHVAGIEGKHPLDEHESALCQALGKRVAGIASQLKMKSA